MSAKDWDAFIEIYGIPSWIITLPASVPAGQESEYRDAAAAVAAGGSGAIPNGSDAKAAAYLECAVDGHVLWGVGIHSSIVTASLKAVVSAVNRAQRG